MSADHEESMSQPGGSASQKAVASRLGLNDNKAGMEGLDKERINNIIIQASKGSRYYENELKKDKMVMKKIASLKERLSKALASELDACRLRADLMLKGLRLQYSFSRHIVHMDMDAFYAAVEMRDNPKLASVPMAVGGESMLSTSNYLARRFGVRAAMPGFIARKLCPQLVIAPLNFSKYRAVSREVRSILRLYDPNMSPMSLDEAYLDFTEHVARRGELSDAARTFPAFSEALCRCEPEERRRVDASCKVASDPESDEDSGVSSTDERTVTNGNEASAKTETRDPSGCLECGRPVNSDRISFGVDVEEAVREMRHRIHLKTRLTASAGIACNCMLAKICSDKNKPNGQYRLEPRADAILEFMKALPIRKVPGIGKVSEKQLSAFGIRTCEDFYTNRDKLCFLFSDTSFDYFLSVYLGLGSTTVGGNDEGPKSKSVERTFGGVSNPSELLDICHKLSLDLSEDLRKHSLTGRTVTIKIKLVTFEVKTRAQSLSFHTNEANEIFKVASALLRTEMKASRDKPLSLRLMGVRMSNFKADESRQQKLTTEPRASPWSFFESLPKPAPPPKEPPPLGLYAYMTDADRQLVGSNLVGSAEPSHGIKRYAAQRAKSVWDDVDSLPPEKIPRPGTKGKVTVCSLLDTDPGGDPWKSLGDTPVGPLSSTPHHSKAPPPPRRGPLDAFGASNRVSPWKEVSEHPTAKPKAQKKLMAADTSSRPVDSYFGGKTRSVWEDFQPSSDDDVICLTEGRDSVASEGSARGGRPRRGRRKRPPASPAKNSGSIFTRTRSKAQGVPARGRTTPTQASDAVPDVITISD